MLNVLYGIIYSNVCLYICVFKKGEYGNRMFYTRRIGKVSLRVESGSTPESVENYMIALEKRRDERVGYM